MSSVVSDLLGKSSQAIIEALIAGERDPRNLVKLAHPRMAAKRPALNGRFDAHDTTPADTYER